MVLECSEIGHRVSLLRRFHGGVIGMKIRQFVKNKIFHFCSCFWTKSFRSIDFTAFVIGSCFNDLILRRKVALVGRYGCRLSCLVLLRQMVSFHRFLDKSFPTFDFLTTYLRGKTMRFLVMGQRMSTRRHIARSRHGEVQPTAGWIRTRRS